MRFNNKTRRRALEDALFLLTSACEIAMQLSRDLRYVPDEYDFSLLERIHGKGRQVETTAREVEACLRARSSISQQPPDDSDFPK